jgi:hypothetical protein
MGRPKKNADEKRDLQVVIKLTKGEYAQLLKLMGYAEKNASEVIRQLVFKERLLKPKISIVDARAYVQLKRIGNNLNQHVKAIYQTKMATVDHQILLELQATLEILGKGILKL